MEYIYIFSQIRLFRFDSATYPSNICPQPFVFI